LFMGGIVGRLFREFSVTLAFAIAVSTVVSLSVTPMICAHFVRAPPSPSATGLDRVVSAVLDWLVRSYASTLRTVLRHRALTMLAMLLTLALTVVLYVKVPKGYFPQDDTGLVFGGTEASTDISFKAMSELQQRAAAIVEADPAVAAVASSVGASTFNPSLNQGRLFISLKPLSERKLTTARVVDRLRQKLAAVIGLKVFMVPAQDLRVGARQSKAQYQFTLWGTDVDELQSWLPKVLEAVRKLPGLIDVSTDREQGGLQADVTIDRLAASRLCVQVQDIDNALNDAFAQRQISTIYTQRNQYRVILEAAPSLQRSLDSIGSIYVPSSAVSTSSTSGAGQVPLSAISKVTIKETPLRIGHLGQFPAATISFNLAPGAALGDAVREIRAGQQEIKLPTSFIANFRGASSAFESSLTNEVFLLVAAIVTMYIILGVLYESFIHPITILSTLPSAGVGALLALMLTGCGLDVMGIIGILLLIGIVKKNAIMMVDFALEAERDYGKSPRDAIYEACLLRFRPILMTTLAALFGALPLMLGMGTGSELRRPLGISIVGGLLLSQVLTLFTTPVIYLALDRLGRRFFPREANEAPE